MVETATVEVKEELKVDVLTDISDYLSFPWPYEDNSIKDMTVGGVFEYVQGRLRGRFMDEVYRVLVPNGTVAFAVPYWNTAKGCQDYRYEYPPLCEQSFLYFNKGWREVNKLELGIVCDFDYTYGFQAEAETAARNEESRSFYIKHYTNCVDALHLMLTKRA